MENRTIPKWRRDQRNIRNAIKTNPEFIFEIIRDTFKSTTDEINLYVEFEDFRRKVKFFDLALVRFLVGNGFIKQVNNSSNFRHKMFSLTKNGAKLITGNAKN